MNGFTKALARAGIIASLYIVLSLLTLPLASGAIQLRISEILTLLPLLYLEAVPALFVGCLLSNLITGCAVFDIILGSLITLTCALLTFLMGKIIKNKFFKILMGGSFPVLLNAFLLPLIWILCYGAIEYAYYLQALFLLDGQALAVYALGVPTYLSITKLKEKGVGFLS